ncbi:uncharacterized protein LOC129908525 [Episyrphus balteatus]|uniref:uncharacterized protein LOC129908525 n=1 Tax=Episyrphus balteatus TaxID=286459 RepID=UPI0024857C8B|nr:uncharacterized protein LOC129908525 [Episyrphus balteatus]
MNSLCVIFGRYDVLVHDLTTDLLNLPKLSSKSDPKIRLWAVKVNGYVADVRSMNREEDLTNGYVMTNLASKLGAGLYQEWQRKRAGIHNANFVQFAEFLNEKVVDLPPDLIRPLSSGHAESKRNQASAKSSRQVLTHQAQTSDSASQPELCKKCNKKQRPLHQCASFKAKEQRLSFVKDNAICFTCLDSLKHDWRVCAKKKTCGTRGCSGRHHPLLHQSRDLDSVLSTAAAPFVPQPHIHSSHVRSNTSVMFKIVPIRLHGRDNSFVDTFAFLDDGSSLTMLEKDVFDELGLQGEPEELTLQCTKGVIRSENSLRTILEVSGVNKKKRHCLKNVYTVKDLDFPSQSIDVSYLMGMYPHLRGLPLKDLRHGKDKEPCAVQTLLGWIVYGNANSTSTEANVFCTHQVSRPTMKFLFHDAIKQDESLHDLVKRHFTTEEFGVTPPRSDLVSQEVRRAMDIMERSLKMGPDNLVHLHAGLFKFRERAIAVNADVKEMFHQIKIVEEDQQCQRILWRDGDTSRKPTVYIMEVMIFGPRCSPTCAQFVKNHHANLFKEECPKALDGLTKRTYVDDYFNSHDSVEEAVSVTKDAIRICK